MPTASRAKHKFCRRIGKCLWNDPTCPSVKRPYAAGPHGKGKRVKLSTYGTLLLEKQKLRNYYAISEKQLQIAFAKAKAGEGQTHEKLFRSLEQRLDSLVYRCGFAPTIFAAKQYVNHGHILVDGKRIDRASYIVREGQVISINAEKSPAIAETAKKSNATAPAYLEVDLDHLTATLVRAPQIDEANSGLFNIMSVIEYYAR
ncbi:MAG: 30S ribosomal protein S4 [Victivallaceae bacterium]|nr:30S ribosomal protein S4 [Victivallaceae bacterium]